MVTGGFLEVVMPVLNSKKSEQESSRRKRERACHKVAARAKPREGKWPGIFRQSELPGVDVECPV